METCTTHKSVTEPGRDCTFSHIFLKKITELWNKINKTILKNMYFGLLVSNSNLMKAGSFHCNHMLLCCSYTYLTNLKCFQYFFFTINDFPKSLAKSRYICNSRVMFVSGVFNAKNTIYFISNQCCSNIIFLSRKKCFGSVILSNN